VVKLDSEWVVIKAESDCSWGVRVAGISKFKPQICLDELEVIHALRKINADSAAYLKARNELSSAIKEDVLSATDRAAMLRKLLIKNGFPTKSGLPKTKADREANVPFLVAQLNIAWVVIRPLPDDTWELRFPSSPSYTGQYCTSESEILDVLQAKNAANIKRVTEAHDDEIPLVWKIASQQRAKGKRVSMAAGVELQGLHYIQGEIMHIDFSKAIVDVLAYGRYWHLPMRSEDDSRYTLNKDQQSDFYWVHDIAHDEDD
jgi:hypothetical protein